MLVSTCTSNRLIPSVACWLSGELGPAADARLGRPGRGLRGAALRARRGGPAAAGDPAAGAAGVRGEVLRQDRQRPHLADDLRRRRRRDGRRPGRARRDRRRRGRCRPTPAARPARSTRSSGRTRSSTTTSRCTGPEVKSLVQRYLAQMIDELGELRDPDDPGRTLLESIELIVPHQANKTMILDLAGRAGLSPDQLYFNIGEMGNVSAAEHPDRDRRRGPRRRDHRPDPGLRARLRRRRRRRVRRAARRPRDRGRPEATRGCRRRRSAPHREPAADHQRRRARRLRGVNR